MTSPNQAYVESERDDASTAGGALTPTTTNTNTRTFEGSVSEDRPTGDSGSVEFTQLEKVRNFAREHLSYEKSHGRYNDDLIGTMRRNRLFDALSKLPKPTQFPWITQTLLDVLARPWPNEPLQPGERDFSNRTLGFLPNREIAKGLVSTFECISAIEDLKKNHASRLETIEKNLLRSLGMEYSRHYQLVSAPKENIYTSGGRPMPSAYSLLTAEQGEAKKGIQAAIKQATTASLAAYNEAQMAYLEVAEGWADCWGLPMRQTTELAVDTWKQYQYWPQKTDSVDPPVTDEERAEGSSRQAHVVPNEQKRDPRPKIDSAYIAYWASGRGEEAEEAFGKEVWDTA